MPGKKLTSEEAAELRRLIWLYEIEIRKWEPLRHCLQHSVIYSSKYKCIAREAEQSMQSASEELHGYIKQLTMKD